MTALERLEQTHTELTFLSIKLARLLGDLATIKNELIAEEGKRRDQAAVPAK